MRNRHVLGSLVSIVLAVGTCGEARSAEGTYKVGVATGQTGYLAVTDGPALKGLQLGVDEINAAGGVNGKWPIELEIRNTNSEPAQTATVTQQLIDAGVQMVLTPCDLDPSVAGGQIAQRAQIPTISLCASTPTLPDLVGNYMFSSWYGDNVTGYVLANYAIQQGYKTAWLHESPDTAYTIKLPEYFGAAFEAAGGRVIGRTHFTMDQQDFSADLTNLKNQNPQPDVIFTSSYEPGLAAFLQQYRAAGLEPIFFAAEGMDTPTMFELPPDVINGIVFTTAGFETPGSPLEAFNKKYKETYGEDPGSVFPAAGYDLAKVIEAAVKSAGATDPSRVRDALANLEDVQGATGMITYKGTNGMPVKSIALMKVTGGKKELISLEVPDASKLPKP